MRNHKTLVRAYISVEPGHRSYRSTVVYGDGRKAALAAISEIKAIDMVAPAAPHDYVAYHVQQWVIGSRDHADYWLDASFNRIRCPLTRPCHTGATPGHVAL